MKKIIIFIFISILMMGLVSCGNKDHKIETETSAMATKPTLATKIDPSNKDTQIIMNSDENLD